MVWLHRLRSLVVEQPELSTIQKFTSSRSHLMRYINSSILKTSPKKQQKQKQQRQDSRIKMQQRQRSKLLLWSLHEMRDEPVRESNDEQELIILIKDFHHRHRHHHHCRAIPATQSSSNNNKNALSRKNSTCCSSSRPQKPSGSTSAVADSSSSHPQAMYSITSVQSQSNKRYPLKRSARPQTVWPVRGSIAFTLLLISLSTLIALASFQQPAEALFFSDSSAAKPAASLPLASALLSSAAEGAIDAIAASDKQPEQTENLAGDSPLMGALQKVVSAAVSSATNQQQQAPATSSTSPSSASSASQSAPSASGSGAQQSQIIAPSSSSSSASSSVANALVSSISSAVASAAVSAAQNALTGGDARSGHKSRQQPNRAMHMALKIAADAIPEVPYNILHNMKKLDHAAPFYNVGKKVGPFGSSKESTSLLASAISSASHGRFGGAAGQLSSILKSPLWKRIADGYDDFASEFRSLFRAPANPMKGSTGISSSTKLLRDISVPALLMLIAAAMPSEWRPVRNRRKLLLPSISDLPQMIDPMSTSGSEQVSSLSAIPFINPALSAPSSFSSLLQANPVANRYQQIQPRELAGSVGGQMFAQVASSSGHPQSRSGDIHLQPDSNGYINQQQQQQHQWDQQAGLQPLVRHPVSGSQLPVEPAAASADFQMQPQQVSSQQPARRVGELALPTQFAVNSMQMSQQKRSKNDNYPQKPVNRISERAPYLSRALSYMPSLLFLSSLTSGKPEINSPLMRRVFGGGVGKNRMVNNNIGEAVVNEEGLLSKRDDQLSERHRYSMIDAEVDSSGRAVEERDAAAGSKPFLLSAMTHALNSALESGLSGFSPNLHLATSSTNNKLEMLADKSVAAISGATGKKEQQQLRRNSPGVLPEQRQLTQLIPQAWKDVIKRTVSSVQQQASTQWRSIEGQFTNWVQDKLKPSSSAPSSTSASSSSPSATSSNAQASAPISNIIASVSSSAMNMFGFANKSSPSSIGTSSTGAPSDSPSSSTGDSSSSEVAKNKNDNTKKQQNNTAKKAFAGFTNMIASVFTNKQTTTPAVGNNSSKVSSTGASSELSAATSKSSSETSTTKTTSPTA